MTFVSFPALDGVLFLQGSCLNQEPPKEELVEEYCDQKATGSKFSEVVSWYLVSQAFLWGMNRYNQFALCSLSWAFLSKMGIWSVSG